MRLGKSVVFIYNPTENRSYSKFQAKEKMLTRLVAKQLKTVHWRNLGTIQRLYAIDKNESKKIDEQSMDSLDMNTIKNATGYDFYPLYKDQMASFIEESLNRESAAQQKWSGNASAEKKEKAKA
jgi:hypothetical protein